MTIERATPACANHPERHGDVLCNECHTPLCPDCRKELGDNVYCLPCIDRAKASFEAAITSNPNYLGALACGVVAAGAGAVLWQQVEILLNMTSGLVAIVIGLAVGKAVVFGAGQKRGTVLQIISVLLTAIGIALGMTLAIHTEVGKLVAAGRIEAGQEWSFTFRVMPKILADVGPITWLIACFGLWEAYKVPMPPKIVV